MIGITIEENDLWNRDPSMLPVVANVKTKALLKINDALELYDLSILRLNIWNRCSSLGRSMPQVSFKVFCYLFLFYASGSLFVDCHRIPNHLYRELSQLNLIKPLKIRTGSMLNPDDYALMQVYLHPYGKYKLSDVSKPHVLDNIPIIFCGLSSYGLRCLRSWHVIHDFDLMCITISKSLKHTLPKDAKAVVSTPLKNRSMEQSDTIIDGLHTTPNLNMQLMMTWSKHDTNVYDLLKYSYLLHPYRLVKHESMLDNMLFVNKLKSWFLDKNLPVNRLTEFDLQDLLTIFIGDNSWSPAFG